MTYEEAEAILKECDHSDRWLTVWLTGGGEIKVCTDCWNAHVAARREARKAELAEYWAKQPKCDCCGERPYRWHWAYYKLCTQCKTRLVKEHNRNLARHGSMAAVASIAIGGMPMVSTQGWAMTKEG